MSSSSDSEFDVGSTLPLNSLRTTPAAATPQGRGDGHQADERLSFESESFGLKSELVKSHMGSRISGEHGFGLEGLSFGLAADTGFHSRNSSSHGDAAATAFCGSGSHAFDFFDDDLSFGHAADRGSFGSGRTSLSQLPSADPGLSNSALKIVQLELKRWPEDCPIGEHNDCD